MMQMEFFSIQTAVSMAVQTIPHSTVSSVDSNHTFHLYFSMAFIFSTPPPPQSLLKLIPQFELIIHTDGKLLSVISFQSSWIPSRQAFLSLLVCVCH